MATRRRAFGKTRHAQRIAEGLRQFLEFEHLFRIGLFMNAVQRSQAAPVQVLRDGLVGGEHELFDQAMGDIAFAAHDAGHLTGERRR